MMAKVFNTPQSSRFEHYDAIASNPGIKGVVIHVKWGLVEPTQGKYDFSLIRRELDYLASLDTPKRLIVRMMTKIDYGPVSSGCNQSDSAGDYGRWFPAYLVAGGGCTQSSATNSEGEANFSIKFWDPWTRARYIAMLQAMATEFDNHPLFEAIFINRETAIGPGSYLNSLSGYSASAYRQGLQSVANTVQGYFDNSTVSIRSNSMSNATELANVLEWQRNSGIAWGLSDTAPDCIVRDLYCTGGWYDPQRTSEEASAGPTTAYNYANENYGGVLPVFAGIESSQLGRNSVGQLGGYAPDLLYRFATQYLHATHILWARNDFTGVSDQRFDPGILALIDENPAVLQTACPSAFVARGGCITGVTP